MVLYTVYPWESRPSVGLSVKRVDCYKTKESSGQISYIVLKNVYPSFPTRRMFGRGRPLLPEILSQTDPFGE